MRVTEGAKAHNGLVQPTGRPPKPVTGRGPPGNNQHMPATRAPEASLASSSALYSGLLWQATGHVQQAPVSVDRASHFPGLYVSYQLKQLPADAFWEAEPAPGGGKRMRLPNHHNRQRCKDTQTPPDSPVSWQSGGRGAGHFRQQQHHQQHQHHQHHQQQQEEAGGECSYLEEDWLDSYPVPAWGPGCRQSGRSKRRPCGDPLRYWCAVGDDDAAAAAAAAAEAALLQQQQQQEAQSKPPDPSGEHEQHQEQPQLAPVAVAAASTVAASDAGVDVTMEDVGSGSAPSTPSPASSQQPVQAMLGGSSRDAGSMMALLAEAVGGEGSLPGVPLPAAVAATPMEVEVPSPVPAAAAAAAVAAPEEEEEEEEAAEGVPPSSRSSREQPQQQVVAVVAALAVVPEDGVVSEALWQKQKEQQQAAAAGDGAAPGKGAAAAAAAAAGGNLDSPRGTSSESDLTCHLRSPESPESDKEGNSSPPLASPTGAGGPGGAAAAVGVGPVAAGKPQEEGEQLQEAGPAAPVV